MLMSSSTSLLFFSDSPASQPRPRLFRSTYILTALQVVAQGCAAAAFALEVKKRSSLHAGLLFASLCAGAAAAIVQWTLFRHLRSLQERLNILRSTSDVLSYTAGPLSTCLLQYIEVNQLYETVTAIMGKMADQLSGCGAHLRRISVNPMDTVPTEREATLLYVASPWFCLGDVNDVQALEGKFRDAFANVVEANGGRVLYCNGGTAFATWNAFQAKRGHQYHACRAALDLLRDLPEPLHHDLQASIVCDRIVSTRRGLSLSIFGSALEQARVLASLNGVLGTNILISEKVFDAVSAELVCQLRDYVSSEVCDLKRAPVFELLGARASTKPDTTFKAALALFLQDDYAGCIQALQSAPEESLHVVHHTRLLELARLYSLDNSTAVARYGYPYSRKFIGWGDRTITKPPLRVAEPPKLRASASRPDELIRTQLGTLDDLEIPRHPSLPVHPPGFSSHRTGNDWGNTVRTTSSDYQLPRTSVTTTDSPRPILAPVVRTFLDTNDRQWRVSDALLGKGGFGMVYLAMDACGTLVVAKRSAVTKSADGTEAILREIRLLSELHHDNIVAYEGSGLWDGHVVVVVEYVPYVLHDIVVKFGPLPFPCIQRYARDILRGLHYLHTHDVVHRDIKPRNILVSPKGRCKVADFGTAAGMDVSALAEAGTPQYMAPEAFQNKFCKASDVWSFGLTVFHMSTGKLPWKLTDIPTSTGAAVANPLARLLAEVEQGVNFSAAEMKCDDGAKVIEFMQPCLQQQPTSRWTTGQLLVHPFVC
eukprot:TRINITY_DN14786_c0_g1_i1.p1 TRINITY_DN14786_c0_g1~~TRINITY_DN14786_c0_g1_i1.p1  ORF type:complete len:767 (+),score=87.92 TRINITY_DN14786_c0_g1_i1:2169-4469(+)